MMVGKRARARHPMKRTTSMTEFSFEDLTIPIPAVKKPDPLATVDHHHDHDQNYNQTAVVMSMVSPRPRPRPVVNRRNSADFALQSSSPPTFLTTCSLCNRRLPPGRDIYMYRGDSAYCSLECRQEQMAHDERREKENPKPKPKESNLSPHSHTHSHSHSSHSPAGSHVSSSANGETVAAL